MENKKEAKKEKTQKNKNKNTNQSTNNNKKQKVKFSKKHPKITLAIRLTILLIILVMVIGAGVIVGIIYGMWGDDFEISEEELTLTGNSFILDSKGNTLAELTGDDNRKIITLQEMADYLPKAYVAIEDERFYDHSGVDLKRTAGAIFTYIVHRGDSSFGGSTITQQLVKNITQENAKSGMEGINRKIKEWAKAYKIEQMLSKEQILELYLNIIFVGGGNRLGVEAGAEYYFGKTAKELSLTECAFMAGINNAPNAYNPYGDYAYGKDENKTKKINRRTKTVLKKMLELGDISQEEYDNSCKEIDEGIKFKEEAKQGKIYSYHTDATISKVISDIAEAKGWTTDYATTYVYGGGLTIYSTQDTEVQKKMEEEMQSNWKKYTQKSKQTKDDDGEYVYAQSAMVVIDNETGYAVGMVGGLGEKNTSRGLNRATQSPRSTGSSIKPIADVLPALEEGLITAATMYNDCKVKFDIPGSKTPYKPTDESTYRGVISVRSAITTSQNVPFVKIMAELTNPVSRSYLEKLGVTTIDEKNDSGLSLALGGLYNGITTFEMAAAYATIENGGVYREPLLYTKVEDSKGNIILEAKQKTTRVCSEENAYILKDMLKTVVQSGTAKYCKISGIDMGAKTGTTNDHFDRWLCGFTNYYTAATWYGYDKNEYVRSTIGVSPASVVYSGVMNSLHKGKAKSTFTKPDGIITIKVCNHTGLRATEGCTETHSEIFVKGTQPKECDERSNAIKVCESSGLLATDYCPNVVTKYFAYSVEKERLNLWTNLSNLGTKAPTEFCKTHTAENSLANALPTLTIVGDSNITLKIGESYIEKGATATDKSDGDITNKIMISGSVNTTKAGTYTVTYKVKNSKNLEVTKQRVVIVKDENPKQTTTPNTNTTTPEKENEKPIVTENEVTNQTTPSTVENTTTKTENTNKDTEQSTNEKANVSTDTTTKTGE